MIRIPGPIPIFISPLFWVMAAVIGWFSSMNPFETLLWMVVIFVSVLFHEFGHALTSVAFGQNVIVELTAYGGVTIRRKEKVLAPWKEFLIGLNGPLAGFLLCGIAYYLKSLPVSHSHPIFSYMLSIAVYINLFWTIINLLPIQPLDGGKLVRVVLEALFGIKGTKIAFFCSVIIATLCGIGFFIIHSYLAGSIFLLLAYEGYRNWQTSLTMTEDDNKEQWKTLLASAAHDLKDGNKEQALDKFMHIRDQVKSGLIFDVATQGAGNILYKQGKKKEAYGLLLSVKKSLSPEGLQVLQQLAYNLGYMNETADFGTTAYQSRPDYETALLNACAHARMGQVKPAVGWIKCAIKDGLPNPSVVLKKEDFDGIRKDPLFQSLTQS